jgi:hypothetical protein
MITKKEIQKVGRMGSTTVIKGYYRAIVRPVTSTNVKIVERALAYETVAGKIEGLFEKTNHGELFCIAGGAAAERMFKEFVNAN